MEILRLRVHDLDFERREIMIRDGHKHVKTTEIYTHVLNRGAGGGWAPP